MAVGTDFSVTKKATKPIVNPVAPVDKPGLIPGNPSQVVDKPDPATARPEQDIDAPVVLTANAGTLTTPPFPLNHARILWNNLLVSATVTQDSGSNANLTLIPNTFQRWQFGASANPSATFTLPTLTSIDTVCVGAHNLADLAGDVYVRVYYDTNDSGSVDTLFGNYRVEDRKSDIMIHLSYAVSIKRLRVMVDDGFNAGEIGYISAGIALQMQRPFFNGHTPITDSDVTEYYHNRTESGEIIGQMIRRQGYKTNAEWKNLDDTWYRAYFATFKQAAKLNPFFFAWNLLEYPYDVGFCRIAKDISAPMQNGFVVKRSLSMELLGAS